jgi:hypothetical protein
MVLMREPSSRYVKILGGGAVGEEGDLFEPEVVLRWLHWVCELGGGL